MIDKTAPECGWSRLRRGGFFRLSDFWRHLKDELGTAENRVSEYAPKTRVNGTPVSIVAKFRELFYSVSVASLHKRPGPFCLPATATR